LAERIDWARRHGVEPPKFVLAQARAANMDLSWLAGRSSACSPRATCCTKRPPNTVAACCQESQAACDSSPETKQCCTQSKQEIAPADDGEHIIAWRALACRGHSMNWLAAVPILIVPLPAQIEILSPAGHLVRTPSVVLLSVADSPAVPPPEAT
jgi:hypothetical protein